MGSLKELHITSDRINDGQFHQPLYNMFQNFEWTCISSLITFITFSTKVKVNNQQNRAFNDQFLFEIMLKEQSFAIICC